MLFGGGPRGIRGGIRGGSGGDPQGIRMRFRGSATVSQTFCPRFGGIRPRELRSFIILKKGSHNAAWAMDRAQRGEGGLEF